jgi:CheY-like chemotaxis protein
MSAQRLLLISDDPLTHLVVEEAVAPEELALIPAWDAKVGLEQAMMTFPQLVLVDMQSPGRGNLELCRQLRSLSNECRSSSSARSGTRWRKCCCLNSGQMILS